MARRRRRKGHRKHAAMPGKTVAHHAFGNRKFRCYGKRVKVKGGKKVARLFCARSA